MVTNLKMGKLFGIEIDLHYTWFIIIGLLAAGLSLQFFPEQYPGLTTQQYWIIGVISAIFLFVSVLIHELAHSLVAKKNNIAVDKITLFFFGGVASIGSKHMSPEKEFKMAIAGPLVSLFLAGFFYLLFKFSNIVYVEAVSFYLMALNLILGLFNLAPGYPLDGGRVLRAVLWKYLKDVKRATKIAAEAGRVVALVLIVWGFLGFFGFMIEINGLLLGGVWFLLLGVFLYFLAGMSYEQIIIKEVLSHAKVKDVMRKKFVSVPSSLSVAELFSDYFLEYNQDSFLVTSKNKLVGYVDVGMLSAVPRHSWLKVSVKDVFIPVAHMVVVKPSTNAFDLLNLMNKKKVDIVPVLVKKKLVGVVDFSTLIKFIRASS